MTIEQQYSPIYDAETNTTIYRMPIGAPTGEVVIPNAEDDGYSVYLAEDLTDGQARDKALHAIGVVVGNERGLDARLCHFFKPRADVVVRIKLFVGGKGVINVCDNLEDAGHTPTCYLYPGDRHEILFEDDREKIFGDILAWLEK